MTEEDKQAALEEFPPKLPVDDRYVSEWATKHQDTIRKALQPVEVDAEVLKKPKNYRPCKGMSWSLARVYGYNQAIDDLAAQGYLHAQETPKSMRVQETCTEKQFFWTFSYENDIHDYECKSKPEAIKAADEWWEQECIDNFELRNGSVHAEEIELIHFYLDDDGERVIEEREKTEVEYTHYHGDLEEHGT